jgi:hypothetical protein
MIIRIFALVFMHVHLERQPQLVQMILTGRRLAPRLRSVQSRQQKRRQNSDDGDDD